MMNLGRAGLLTVLVLCVFSLWAEVPYVVVPPETVQQRLDLFKGDDTAREGAVVRLFAESGCLAANLSEQPVPHRKQPNVICVLPGTTPKVIVVGAHFDHVPRGDGVVDNWSGAALLPSLFKAVAGSARKHTYIFVAFTGEEDGLLGSSYFVKHLPKDQLAMVEAMINLDTLGLGPTKVWVSQSDPRLVNGMVQMARMLNLPLAGMNMDGVGESDEESFIRERICTISVHSLTPQTLHVLHRSDDNRSAIQFHDYYDTYQLLAGYLAALDTMPIEDGHSCKIKPV
jgi:hypothetical protein